MGAYVHPTAVIDAGAHVGDGAQVWHFVHISRGAEVGEDVVLGQNVFVGEGVRIGARSRVQNNVSLFSGLELAADVFLGPGCVFTNVRNPRVAFPRRGAYDQTRVGQGVTVGANATIIGDRTLGAYAFIGAGAVVTHDVAPYALVVGTPARPVGFVCCCGQRLPTLGHRVANCACGLSYRLGAAGDCEPVSQPVPGV